MNGFGCSNPYPIRQFHFKIQSKSKSDKLIVSKSKSCLNAKAYQLCFSNGKIDLAKCLPH